MERNKAVVISVDAMTKQDLEELKKRECFSSLLSSAALVESIECVFPTYTYPCHASIITGLYPDRTGIWHNEKLNLERERNEWNWWEKDNKAKTIIEYANEHRLTTAAVSWPVTAGGNALFTIPEIWPVDSHTDEEKLYRSSVSSLAWPVFEKNRYILNEKKDRYYDIYTTENVAIIIRKYSPDLTLIHLSAIDSMKHERGSRKDGLQDAYDFIDSCVLRITDAVRESGSFPDTTFFILGDHGQMDIRRIFGVNRVLSDLGYITIKDGRISKWRILCHPSTFSSVVYLDGIGEEEALSVFQKITRTFPRMIRKVYSSSEAREKYHLSGPFSLVLESTEGTALAFSPSLPVLSKSTGKASGHGYAPDRGPKSVLAVSGKKANPGFVLPSARLVDEGPTILSLFGIEMENVEGKVINGILKK